MQVGQKVVCVDDRFPTPLAKHYLALPVKGKTYTIRAVFLGRAVLHGAAGASDGEIGVLLVELKNPPDPRNIYGQELGFNSTRFRPLDELTDTEEKVEERELVLKVPEEEDGESWKSDS